MFSHHPNLPILVTIATDKLLSLYHSQTRELLDRMNLGVLPTCVKWNPDGSLLVVGFQNGTLKIFESKSVQSIYGKFGGKVERPGLELVLSISDTETKTSVLGIEFSKRGDLMAVSYDNQKINKEEDQLSKNKDGSFVVVYVYRDSPLKANVNTQDSKNLYSRHFDIICPSINETYENKSNVYGMAVYFMAFSSDDRYLMVYFQIVDNF